MKHYLFRKKVSKVFVSLLSFSIFVVENGLYAQQKVDIPVAWTLQQCISYAKENNLEVQTSKLTEQSVEQDLFLSKATKYPNLTASMTQLFNHNNSTSSNGSVSGSFSGAYSLTSDLILYNGNYLNNDVRQKENEVQASHEDVLATENNIVLQITQAYLEILLANENVNYFDDLLVTAMKWVDVR